MRLALVWCTFWFATFFCRNLKLFFSQLHPPDHPLFPFKGKVALPKRQQQLYFNKKFQTAHALERELLCKYRIITFSEKKAVGTTNAACGKVAIRQLLKCQKSAHPQSPRLYIFMYILFSRFQHCDERQICQISSSYASDCYTEYLVNWPDAPKKHQIPWFHVSTDQLTLVIYCRYVILLSSDIGIITGHYKDPYKPTKFRVYMGIYNPVILVYNKL